MAEAVKFPIVLNTTFIEATRDTGYRSTAAAVAELVDNAIQASAKNVRIFVREVEDDIEVSVLDDGTGMDATTLRRALQFGGSMRFGDRGGLGRFGMGLPNASVSQARRVDVYTWRVPNVCISSHLDVDDIAAGRLQEIPTVSRGSIPKWAHGDRGFSGTLVVWSRCDRLDNRRISTISRKLHEPLGRMFRHFIWRGVNIFVNGQAVVGIDPLFLAESTPMPGAAAFGEPLTFEVRLPHKSDRTSTITVRFSELPVAKWHDLPVEEKRKHRIVDGAGLSILRAGREVDYGWWFFGAKRRENYDSWWRGELSFDPELDELFSITHSKQGINPTQQIREILTPDLEAVARQLNGRVQAAFAAVKQAEPPPPTPAPSPPPLPERAEKTTKATRRPEPSTNGNGHAGQPRQVDDDDGDDGYEVIIERLGTGGFFEARQDGGRWRLTINSAHGFYREVYEPLRGPSGAGMRRNFERLLLAYAKAEAGPRRGLKDAWASHLSELLGGGA